MCVGMGEERQRKANPLTRPHSCYLKDLQVMLGGRHPQSTQSQGLFPSCFPFSTRCSSKTLQHQEVVRTPTAQNVLLVLPVQGLLHFPLGQSWTLHSEPPTPSVEQQKNKRGWKPCVLTVGPHRPSNHKCDETAWKLATKLRLLGSLCQEEWRGSKHGVDPSVYGYGPMAPARTGGFPTTKNTS